MAVIRREHIAYFRVNSVAIVRQTQSTLLGPVVVSKTLVATLQKAAYQ